MSACAPAAEPLAVSPDEQAVVDWMKLRLAFLRERSDIEAINLAVTYYPHLGEIETQWIIHSGGQCVVSQPSIAEGVRALREKLANLEQLANLEPNGTHQP